MWHICCPLHKPEPNGYLPWRGPARATTSELLPFHPCTLMTQLDTTSSPSATSCTWKANSFCRASFSCPKPEELISLSVLKFTTKSVFFCPPPQKKKLQIICIFSSSTDLKHIFLHSFNQCLAQIYYHALPKMRSFLFDYELVNSAGTCSNSGTCFVMRFA